MPPPTATLALTPNLEATVAATNQATQQAIKQTLGTPNSASPASLSTLTLTPTATLTTTQPTLIPLAAYLATQTGVLGVESEFRQVLLQLDNVRRTIDALQAQSASNWANLVDVVPYRDQVTRIGILLRRAGNVSVLWIDSREGNRVQSVLFPDSQDARIAYVNLWKHSWSAYVEAGQKLLAATRLADIAEFEAYQLLMKVADVEVKSILTLTLVTGMIQLGG